ncbi:MAG: outer membrane lipoprotein chaperone LolA [Gammaproteobacteria bacterium]|nr:outer membrane lipoprotein chaperone LolA [Gammaproteobacteria bacterium]
MRRLLILALGLWLPCAGLAGGAGAQLRSFLEETVSLDARFVQERVGERGTAPERATGRLRLQRPGRFRWDYDTPYVQTILADGERLWIHDPDLEQVTVRPQAEALGRSPARLLSGGLDLDAHYGVVETTDRREAGLDWVELRPLGGEGEFESVRFGFAGPRLVRMVMSDNLGFVTTIEFSDININHDIDPEVFTFTPPPGVDVLGE